MRIRTVVSTLALVALAALSGCGSDSDGAKALTKEQVKSALLTLDDLGDGFRVDEDDDDDDSDASLGCLDEFEDLDKVGGEPDSKAEVSFEADNDLGIPGVMSGVVSFEDIASIEKGLAAARKLLAECDKIDETDEDGMRMELTVSTDDDKAGPDVTDQLNIHADGSMLVQGLSLPLAFHVSMIQIDNHVAMAGFFTIDEDSSTDAERVTDAVFTRFSSVVEGGSVEKPEPLNLEPVDLNDFLPAGAA